MHSIFFSFTFKNYRQQRCHSRVMTNPEKWEGHFRIFTYEGKRLKLFIKKAYFWI